MHQLLKAIGVFAILMLFSLLSTGSEFFSTKFNEEANWDNPGGAWGSYNEKTYSEGAWFFHSTRAVRGTPSATGDATYGSSQYNFRDRGVFSVHNTAEVSGMTGFSMQLRDWMTDSGVNRNLKISMDGGENWETIQVINKAWFDEYQVYQEYVYFFPSGPQSFATEEFVIELDGGGNTNAGRINIGKFVVFGTMTTVATPAFNPAGGEFFEAVEVEITTATPGASIYYTLNGADPTQSDNLYSDPIAVDDDVTIKARAFADGMDLSATSQATYTFPEITEVATLAALRDMPVDGSYYKYTGNAVIVAMDGFRNRKFIQDATAAILIDDNPGVITTEYDLYDVISDVIGKLNVFNNMLRFQPEFNTPEATLNTPVEPVLFLLDEITPDDQAKLIKFEEVIFTTTGSFQNGENYTISDGLNEFIFRTDFWDVDYIGDPVPTLPVNISGVMIQYQDDLQIVARFQDDIELADPPEDPGIITLSTTILPSFRNVYTGNISDVQFYTVEASNLDGNLTITAGSPLKVSLNCTDDFATTLVLTETGGNVAEHKIYVRAFPVSTGSFNPVINHTDGFVAQAITTQVTGTTSQIPSGYYSTATGFGEVLMTQLHEIINDHDKVSYESIWTHFETTDARFDGSVWNVFSYIECEESPYSYTFGDDQQGTEDYPDEEDVVYNREHLWPRSWWGGDESEPMHTDLHHIYPADRWVNSQKSNFPFGEISEPSWTSLAGNKRGNNNYGSAYSGMAFEPVDELKGDFARTYFYMATRYMDQLPAWSTHSVASSVLDGSEFPGFESWFITMLLEWHENDPVSQKEIERNNAIYALQNNRNPFIDYPDFAYLVWGDVPEIPVGELCNLDFEDWFNDLPYCWYGVRSNIPQSNVSRYEDNPQSGSYAVRLVNTATSHQRFSTHPVSVTDGVEYAITFWAKGKGEVRTGLFDDRETGFGYAPYNAYVIVDSDEWSQHTQTLTAANTSDIAEFIFSLRNTDETRNHLQIDNVSIEIVDIEDPVLFVDPDNLTQLNYEEGAGPSASKSFKVSGVNLDGSNVILTASDNFKISENDTKTFGTTITLEAYDGAEQIILVQLKADLPVAQYAGNVSITGGGAAEVQLALSGEVIGPLVTEVPFETGFGIDENWWADGTMGSYNEKSYTEGGWYLYSSSAVRGTGDETFDDSAYSFRDTGGFTLHNQSEVNGITGFSLQLRNWMGTPTNPASTNRYIEISFDGGFSWETIQMLNSDWFEEFQVYQEFIYYFVEEQTFEAEELQIKISGGSAGSTAHRINIGQFKALDEGPPPTTFTVEFSVVDGNGTLTASVAGTPISSGDAVEEGSDVLFTATPDQGYQIKEWKLNGNVVENRNIGTLQVESLDDDILVSVEFELIEEDPEPVDLHIAIEENMIIANEECFFAMAIIALAGGDYVFTVKDGAEVNMAAGQKIRFLPGSSVESGGYLHAFISQSNPCARPFAEDIVPEREDLTTYIDVIDDEDGSLFFKMYPNPAESEITLEMGRFSQELPVRIEILNSMGNLVFSELMPAQQAYRLNLADKQPGMYVVRVFQGNKIAVERLIKR